MMQVTSANARALRWRKVETLETALEVQTAHLRSLPAGPEHEVFNALVKETAAKIDLARARAEDKPQNEIERPQEAVDRPVALDLKRSDLGPLFDESGAFKNCYSYGADQVITINRRGGSKGIVEELDLLQQVHDLGYPTIDARLVRVDGEYGILMPRYEVHSQKIVSSDLFGSPRLLGSSPHLNNQSIADLKRMKALNNNGPVIYDLQFLIDKDGHVVVADPHTIYSQDDRLSAAIRDNNDKIIDILIQAAQPG